MKSPRAIILEKHRAVEARLENIRAEDLAAYARVLEPGDFCPPEVQKERRPAKITHGWQVWAVLRTGISALRRKRVLAALFEEFWLQSLWPWRRVWLGMSAVWLVILAINLPTEESGKRIRAEMRKPNAEVIMSLREQKQLMVQLLEPATPSILSRPRTSGPRSERRQTVMQA